MFRVVAWGFLAVIVINLLIGGDTTKANWNAVWFIVSGMLIVALAEIAAAIRDTGGKKE